MGDPRNYVSWYIAAVLGFKNVPLELRFNWDDTSLFVAGEERGAGACVGIAFTSDEVIKEMERLNRSLGMQAPSHEKGRHCTPRMVQWGVLASGSGRLEACVCKIYDRSIAGSSWQLVPTHQLLSKLLTAVSTAITPVKQKLQI